MRAVQRQGQGDWLLKRVRGWGRVESVAGIGFEAYARLLHPVPDHGGARADAADAERSWQTRRWAEVAARRGTVMHPLVQWGRFFEPPNPYSGGSSVGWLDPEVLAALVPALENATSTPTTVVAGVWNGWGGHAIVSPDTLSIPPGREFALLQASLREFADPDWGRQSVIGWSAGSRMPSVQLLWPDDHRWVVATEIDWDSTIVAGPRSLIDELLGDPRFETFEVPMDADLSWGGDTIT